MARMKRAEACNVPGTVPSTQRMVSAWRLVLFKGIAAFLMAWTQCPLRLFCTSKSWSLIAHTLQIFLVPFTYLSITTKLTFLSLGKHLVPLLINNEPGMKAWARQICHLCSPVAPTTDSHFLWGREKDCSITCQFQESPWWRAGGVHLAPAVAQQAPVLHGDFTFFCSSIFEQDRRFFT